MRSGKASLMERVAAFIVDKRNIIFLIYIAAAVFCIFSSGWVEVSDSLTKYLPESTETQIGLELMDDEFTTFGTARIVVENVSYEQAEKICADIERVPGVKEVAFDDSPEHYNEAAALVSVTFDGENDDEVSVLAMDTLRDMLSVYDLYVNTEVGVPPQSDNQPRAAHRRRHRGARNRRRRCCSPRKPTPGIPALLITFGAGLAPPEHGHELT